MIIAVLILMALMMTLGLVISLLGARWPQIMAALMGAPMVADQLLVGQVVGGSGMRALMRA